jgi:tRNA (guanine-N7-)-methyltransferase
MRKIHTPHNLSKSILRPEDLPQPTLWQEVFGRDAPLVIEIGAGKGHFIRSYAQAEPHKNFIAIERFMKWTKHNADRLPKEGMDHVKLLCGMAQDHLTALFPDQSIDEIHVTFPDPWPKRKHHKHRILQKTYVELFHQKLKKGGELHITTDHQDYFEFAMKEFAPLENKLFTVVPKQDYPHKTNYQIKYEREGRPIYFFQANRV